VVNVLTALIQKTVATGDMYQCRLTVVMP